MGEIKIWTETKDIRRAAFAVGFGLTMGKFAGECVKAALDGVVSGITRGAAKNGNEIAQEVCDKAGIEYETNERS